MTRSTSTRSDSTKADRRSSARLLGTAGLLFFALLVVGCQTAPGVVTQVESVDDAALAELQDIELLLVGFRGAQDTELLAEAQEQIAELNRVERRNRQYDARLTALQAELALLSGDRAAAARLVQSALEEWPSDEFALLTQARLANEPESRLQELTNAVDIADTTLRLRAERGNTLVELGRPGDALTDLDAALAELPDPYQTLYGPVRDRAWALRESENIAAASAAYLNEEPLTFVGMTVLTQSESLLLDFITAGRVRDPLALHDELLERGFFLPDAPGPQGITARRDAAYLLWRLLVTELGREELLTRYSDRFAEREGATSPVPDVAIDDPWFDAVLGLVERELMELPDGVRFLPDEVVSGLDFYSWLQETASY